MIDQACLSSHKFPVSAFELDHDLIPPGMVSDAKDVRAGADRGRRVAEDGNFRAECIRTAARRGLSNGEFLVHRVVVTHPAYAHSGA